MLFSTLPSCLRRLINICQRGSGGANIASAPIVPLFRISLIPLLLHLFHRTQIRSFIIGYPCHSLNNSLTYCCLVDLIDVTLACEDANSKLVEVVSVAEVEGENHVGNILLHIWGLRLDHKAKEILS